jgi:hypothetical protein
LCTLHEIWGTFFREGFSIIVATGPTDLRESAMKFTTLSFQIEEGMYAELRAAARAAGDRSVSSLLREVVRKVLDERSGHAERPHRKREASPA